MPQRLPAQRAFTLVELLVVIAIIAIVIAVLFPVFSPPRHPAYRTACASHLKQINMALMMYLQDYDDRLPPLAAGSMSHPETVPALLHPYIKNGSVWQCPKLNRDARRPIFYGKPGVPPVDYGYNWLALAPEGQGVFLREVASPALTVSFAETASYLAAPTPLTGGWGASAPSDRHGEQTAVAWLDGHVKWMKRPVLDEAPTEENGERLGGGISAFRYWNRR